MKKCLIIYGSPRENGNTDRILNYLKEEIVSKYYSHNSVYLRKINIIPCDGCDICSQSLNCKLKDDVDTILKDIITCDLILFASPVYFGTVTALAKAWIDRLQVFYKNKSIITNHKKLIVVSVAAEKNKKVFDSFTVVFKYVESALNIKETKTLFVNGFYEKADIELLLCKINIKEYYDFVNEL
ncbi:MULTISPECIES: flavodoxin family protein [Blautia]|uniref:flavodoxin family protein n=1 Tax=Blautia TaxID=572511 RepID=UPI00139066A0|nr:MULTISPECIES: flavodoxin family protein [Blautia]